jgi:type II secretory pathway component PulF
MLYLNQYLATVRDESHQITKRLVNATSLKRAVFRLQMEKFRVISVEQRPNPTFEALKQGKLVLGSPASARELATFSMNLALMGLVLQKLANVLTSSITTCCVF